jgi:UDP-N-acetylmuramyl tripeptide synthase
MTLFTKIFALAGFLAIAATSCTPCQQCQDCQDISIEAGNRGTSAADLKKDLATQLSGQTKLIATAQTFKFEAAMLKGMKVADLEKVTKLDENKKEENTANDALLVGSIFNALMAAENKMNALEVSFSITAEPVEEGFVIFGITSEVDRDLDFQMFNAETFEMVAFNKFNIMKGSNYKALNVKDFANGTYLIKIMDDKNAELIQRVEIANPAAKTEN